MQRLVWKFRDMTALSANINPQKITFTKFSEYVKQKIQQLFKKADNLSQKLTTGNY